MGRRKKRVGRRMVYRDYEADKPPRGVTCRTRFIEHFRFSEEMRSIRISEMSEIIRTMNTHTHTHTYIRTFNHNTSNCNLRFHIY